MNTSLDIFGEREVVPVLGFGPGGAFEAQAHAYVVDDVVEGRMALSGPPVFGVKPGERVVVLTEAALLRLLGAQ
jgi:hypothetical protein